MTLAGGIRSNYGGINSLLKIMAIQKEYSDTTTMEVQAVRLALPGFYTNHHVGQVGFLRVLRFPPTKTLTTKMSIACF